MPKSNKTTKPANTTTPPLRFRAYVYYQRQWIVAWAEEVWKRDGVIRAYIHLPGCAPEGWVRFAVTRWRAVDLRTVGNAQVPAPPKE